MARRTQNSALTILAATIAATALISVAEGAQRPTPISETGEVRELVNRRGCWPGEIAEDWDRCLFR
jgi:hypothetical protein